MKDLLKKQILNNHLIWLNCMLENAENISNYYKYLDIAELNNQIDFKQSIWDSYCDSHIFILDLGDNQIEINNSILYYNFNHNGLNIELNDSMFLNISWHEFDLQRDDVIAKNS